MLRVKTIRAKAFRGVGSLCELRLGGKNLLLFGDNGTGKSSLIEALELALTNNIASLSNRGQGISVARHSTHVECANSAKMVEVVLADSDGEYRITGATDPGTQPPKIKAYLDAARGGTFILRRSRLADFIEASPSERYAAIRPFLGMEEYEQFEAVLKSTKDAFQKEYDTLCIRRDAEAGQIRSLLKIPQTIALSNDIVLSRFNEMLDRLQVPAASSLSELDRRYDEIRTRIQGHDVALSKNLAQYDVRVSDYLGLLPSTTDLQGLLDALDANRSQEIESTKTFYEQVLTLGMKWIAEGSLSSCPLCEQPIDGPSVIARAQKRLDENRAVIESRNRTDRTILNLLERLNRMTACGKPAGDQWELIGLPRERWPYAALDLALTNLADLLRRGREVSVDEARQACSQVLGYDLAGAKKTEEDLLKPLRGSVKVDTLTEMVSFLTTHDHWQRHNDELGRLESKIASIRVKAQIANSLHEAAVAARKQCCREVFESISLDVREIYSKIHPEELVGGVTVDIKSSQSGSAVIKGDFATVKQEDPRAYYSESHLDTLGLAIFLALRRLAAKTTDGFGLVVLDDVLTSIDAPHRKRVAEYLLTELGPQQLILTTHNRLWFEWLLRLQSQLGVRDKFVNRRIVQWSLKSGPVISDVEGDYELLVKRVEGAAPYEEVVPIAGRFLESLLQELRYSLSLAVEAKPGERYNIGDIWPGFTKKCRKEYPALWSAIQTECNELNNTWIIRNWGTHSNDWAKDLSQNEAMQFIRPIIRLYPKLHCMRCNHLIEVTSVEGEVSCKKGCLAYRPEAKG